MEMMEKVSYRILLVASEESELSAVRERLAGAPTIGFDLQRVASCATAKDALGRESYDACLLLFCLSGADGGDFVHEFAGGATPLFLLLSEGELEVAVGSQCDFADYLVKEHLSAPLLALAIRSAIGRKRSGAARLEAQQLAQISADERANERLNEQARNLKASEERFRRLFESAKDGILILDARSGKIEDVNPFLCDLLGYPEEDFLGRQLWEIGTFRDIAASQEAFRELQENRYIRYEDLPLEDKNGQIVSVEFVSNVYQSGDKEVIQCNIRDISARVQSAELLRLSEVRYRSLFESNPHPMWVYSRQTLQFLAVNEAAIAQYGYSRQEFLAMTLKDIRPPEEIPNLMASVATPQPHNGNYGFWRHRKKDGTVIEVEIATHEMLFAGQPARLALANDVTARRIAEKQIKFQAHLLSEVGQAVIAIDPAGRVTYWNRYAEELYGWSAREAVGQIANDLLVPEMAQHQVAEIMAKLGRGERWSGEFMVQRRDGTTFPAAVTNTPFFDEAEVQSGIIGISKDITERKRTEMALRENQEYLRFVIDASNDGIWSWNLATDEFAWSERIYKILGLSPDSFEPTLQSQIALIHPDDIAPFQQEIERTIQQDPAADKPLQRRVRYRKSDGTYCPILVRGTLQRDAGGQPLRIVGSFSDLTGLIKAEQEREAQSREIVTIWESMSDAFYGLDTQWRFNRINSRGAQLLKKSPQELMGKTLWETFPAIVGTHFERHYRRAVEEQVKVNFEAYYPPYDAWREVHAYPSPDGLSIYFHDITDRKRAEILLLESRQRLELATKAAQIGIWDWNAVDNKLVWDAQMFALYGISEQDFSGAVDFWQNSLHPDDRKGAEADLLAALDGSGEFHPQFRIIRPNGEVRFIEAHAVMQSAGDGSPGHMIGVNWDITQRKQDEAALRLSEERYRSLTQATAQIIWTISPEGKTTEPSQTWCDYTGQSIEESAGWGWFNAMHPDDIDPLIAAWSQNVKTKSLYEGEYRLRGADGNYRLFATRGVPVLDGEGGIREWVGTCTDIQDRRDAEEERDRFFTISLDLLCIADQNGYFKRLNPAFEETLGYSKAELMAKPFLEWVHSDDREATLAIMRELDNGKTTLNFANRYQCSDGSYRWLSWVAVPFGDLIYAAAHDISSLKNAQTALHKANDELELHVMERTAELETANELLRIDNIQREMAMETLRQFAEALQIAKEEADTANAAKSEFLSRMSHELRTPLNAILGFGQILEMRNLAPKEIESVAHILTAGRHLLGLINEVLDITRVEAGHFELALEAVATDEIVSQVCAMMRPIAAKRRISLTLDFGPDADNRADNRGSNHVLADRQRLKQVLMNLLSNAIKYNREGGQVSIICEPMADDFFAISIRDTGQGISPQDLPKLFTPFERLGAAHSAIEGTGLGLVLSQRLVSAMDGTLTVQSVIGRGTTFMMRLPQTPAPDQRQSALAIDALTLDADGEKESAITVLYIEDNASNLRLVKALFESRPHWNLVSATEGNAGLELAQRQQPQLVLLDLNLPGMQGAEVLAHLQNSPSTCEIPVVIVSADATPRQIEQLMSAGAKAYLTKPLDIRQFLATLDGFLQPKT